jgi:hypothetical protein
VSGARRWPPGAAGPGVGGPDVGGADVGRRALWLAVLAGVAVATVLVLVLRLTADPGSGPDDVSASDGSTSLSSSSSSSSSTTRPAGSAAATATSIPVTVDVPRADEEPVPDLAGPGLAPDTAPDPVGPITDPQEAATAYLVAAESVTSDDADRRHRRAEPYMAPENPEARTGVLVADPPPAGSSRTIEILTVTRWSGNEEGDRVAYEIHYQPHLSPTIPAGDETSPEGDPRLAYVVVVRQDDGRWLVAQRAATLDPAE